MLLLFGIAYITTDIRHEAPYFGSDYQYDEKKRTRAIKIEKALILALAALTIGYAIYLMFFQG